jgi:hypothetical protein
VYALIAFAEQMGIALTEGELAGSLFHHSGKRAGQCLTVTAAGVVVDELEAARWVTVQRRAGARGRHRFIAHGIAPDRAALPPEKAAAEPVGSAAESAEDLAQEGPDGPLDDVLKAAGSSPVSEGLGSPLGEGSLAKESPTTDRPDDARPASSAVGEVQVVGTGPVETRTGVRRVRTAPVVARCARMEPPSPPPRTVRTKTAAAEAGDRRGRHAPDGQ